MRNPDYWIKMRVLIDQILGLHSFIRSGNAINPLEISRKCIFSPLSYYLLGWAKEVSICEGRN